VESVTTRVLLAVSYESGCSDSVLAFGRVVVTVLPTLSTEPRQDEYIKFAPTIV